MRIGFAIFYITRIYNRTENVFYDTDYLYFKNKYTTQKVKLQNIKRIERTLSDQRILGMQHHNYKIDFINEFSMNESVNIWISSIHNHIIEFEKYLDYHARSVGVKHTVKSF